jgi:hypothetical protein
VLSPCYGHWSFQLYLAPKWISLIAGTGGCNGATQELAFGYVESSGGISLESSYPYTGCAFACFLPTLDLMLNR